MSDFLSFPFTEIEGKDVYGTYGADHLLPSYIFRSYRGKTTLVVQLKILFVIKKQISGKAFEDNLTVPLETSIIFVMLI